MENASESLNKVGHLITHDPSELWSKVRDVIWLNYEKQKDVMRFGWEDQEIFGEKHTVERPRFINSMLEIILLAKEALEEE